MRGGFTYVEVLLALTLSFALAAGTWSLVLVHSRGSVQAAAASDRLDATRIVRGVVGAELRGGLPGRDWTVVGRDSVRLRAFRGVAVPCGPAVAGVATVAVRSRRRPEPAKDSVLVLGTDGRWAALDLEDARPASLGGKTSAGGTGGTARAPYGGCSVDPSETVEEWAVPGLDGEYLVARTFERGSYHLVDKALRYRSGSGGRQPLTLGLFDPPETGMEATLSNPVALRLRLSFADSGRGTISIFREMTLWPHHP